MSDADIQWNQKGKDQAALGPHRDYPGNLLEARSLCNRVQKSLPEGMRVYIVNSQDLIAALLMITFRPRPNAKMGNYATPIFLHQPSRDYSNSVEKVINVYFKFAKYFNDKNSKQPLLL
jgi:hypothetical protein